MSLKKKPKFLIEPFKHKVSDDPLYASKTWKLLEDAILEVFHHNESGLSFEELYRNAYNMVLHKYGDRLYSGVHATVTAHLRTVAGAILASSGMISGSSVSASAQPAASSGAPGSASGAPGGSAPSGGSPLNVQAGQGSSLPGNGLGSSHQAASSLAGAGGGITMTTGGFAEDTQRMTAFLDDVARRWKEHDEAMQLINDIFMYMDRTYVKHHNKPGVHDVGLRLWRDVVVRQPQIRNTIRNSLLSFVHRERVGDCVDRNLLKAVVQMLSDLGPAVYAEELETPLLHGTVAFYERESESLLASCDCAEYLRRTETRLQEEAGRTREYMDGASTVPRICAVVEREMVGKRLHTLMSMEESGFLAMVRADRHEDLKRMYTLFSRVPGGLDAMKEALAKHIKETGAALVLPPASSSGHGARAGAGAGAGAGAAGPSGGGGSSSAAAAATTTAAASPVVFVQRLLAEREKYDKLIGQSFYSDKGFAQVVGQSFESFLNRNPRAPEFLSLFVDDLLRRGVRGMSTDADGAAAGAGAAAGSSNAGKMNAMDAESNMNAMLDKVMMLFRYLHEKDVFEKYARTHLAKRLLSGKTFSDDAERVLLGKLKTECGFQYSAKLEGMFQDMRTSQDTMLSYRSMLEQQSALGTSSVHGNPPMSSSTGAGAGAGAGAEGACAPLPTVEMNVTVLTTGCWPNVSPCHCQLPVALAESSEHFKQFYLAQHSGRKLAYQTNLGTADLKLVYPAPEGNSQGGSSALPRMKHELNVTTYQMIILLLFNDRLEYTYSEIQEFTQIPHADLQKNLIALSMIKGKNVLTKTPGFEAGHKEIGADDVFRFNANFKNKLYKIHIGSIRATKESEPEKNATRARVEEDRKPTIEAAIVRIMKARKRLDINTIVTEVTKQLSSRFLPNPHVVKKRIESLIEREFIERDADDRRFFRYLA